ncbi:MAG: 50S ribosomal protein L11 methyltransferase [Rhodospirillaceae bacterium]|nr:50S ribosomal protein L11 methyltransferase [Rhodospirillaceae bacterium]
MASVSKEWIELTIQTKDELIEPLTELLRKYTLPFAVVLYDKGERISEIFQVSDLVRVYTYIPVDSKSQNIREMVDVGLKVLSIIHETIIIDEKHVNQAYWEQIWKTHFSILPILDKLVIKPVWQELDDKDDRIVINLDPGMAFGTGHHPTTRMCLEELSRQELTGKSILDIGSGSGILSIAAVKLGALSCIGIDIDENAIDSALNNIEMNGVSENITLQTGVLDDLDSTFKYDVVVANITAQIIINLVPSIASYLKPNGIVITSGILSELFPEVENIFNQLGFKCSSFINSGDWSLGVFSIT